jgi:hypothetical protein
MARYCSSYSFSISTQSSTKNSRPLHTQYVIAKTIENAFEYISSHFGVSQLYFDSLITIIREPERTSFF